MALPKINGNSFGKPNNFVGEALNAFLSTSQEFRQLTEAAGRSRERDQNTFLKSRADNRANIRQEDQLINSQVGREISLGEFAIRMEEAEYKKNTLRPMREEALRLDLKMKKATFASKREERLAKEDRRLRSQQELQAFDDFASSEDTMFEPVSEVSSNTVYWDGKNERPLMGTAAEGGGIDLVDREGNKVSSDISSLSKIKSFEPSLMLDSKKLLDDAARTGSPQFQKIREMNAALDNKMREEELQSDPDENHIRGLKVRRRILESFPEYQQMKLDGTLDSAEVQDRKKRQAEEQVGSVLRMRMGSDEGARSFIENNPQTVRDLGGMSVTNQIKMVDKILSNKEKGNGGAGSSAVQRLQADLRLQQIIQKNAADAKSRGEEINDSISEKAQDKEFEIRAKLQAIGAVGESVETGLGTRVNLPAGGGVQMTRSEFFRG